ncbi:hypothetical protein [Chryseobacterium oryctis]|uniref:Uncharacterized protein n=1 Tax=Chryseobacterium oryctis TaxID=2952618 RepID=A0ABT3HNV8_9FLAO|nr:hypothetical protein [Chryseobacterium oryctis]MCW3161466.1 hypothetical protein [Chryseobacterium oryctis]
MKNLNIILLLLFSYSFIFCQGQNKEEKKSIEIGKTSVDNRISNRRYAVKAPIKLSKINCIQEIQDIPNYNLNCENFKVSNTIFEGNDKNRYELISFTFKDIDKAIIRKINNEDLETSSPIIFKSATLKDYIFFFPINGENHFGWKLYMYKNKILYPLGQRAMYWKPEYEESSISYSEILNLYESNGNILVEIPNKYVIKNDSDYKNYPNYFDGKYYEKGDNLIYEFSTENINYYKKYENGLFEGDYNRMINNNVIDLIK